MHNTDIIREARELCERATPGEWYTENGEVFSDSLFVGDALDENNSTFIARSRTLIPELLDLLAEMDAEIARLKDAFRDCESICDYCKYNHGDECENPDFDCMTCDCDCVCKSCRDNSSWEWRGAGEGDLNG